MTARLSFTAIFEIVDDGWTQGRIEELPAVITAAPTAGEARELLIDALAEYLRALGQSGDRIAGPDRATGPEGRRENLDVAVGV